MGAEGVHVEVVGDEQTQVDGVVGNQLGRAGLEDVQLCLCPIEVAGEVADPGVAEFGLLAEQALLVVEVDLAEQERGAPHVVLEDEHIAEVQFDAAPQVQGQPRHIDRAVEQRLCGGGVVEVEREEPSPIREQPRRFRGLAQVLQRGPVLVGQVEGGGRVQGNDPSPGR